MKLPKRPITHKYIRSLFSLFFPRTCLICGRSLAFSEDVMCMRCHFSLPVTNSHLNPDSPVMRLFWGEKMVKRAASYFLYTKESPYRAIIRHLKYNGEKSIGVIMGKHFAKQLVETGFFDGSSLIIPVPIHPKRLKERGYNQSECIASGVSLATGIPVDTESLIRIEHNTSQTHRSANERWLNTKNAFALIHPERVAGKHIILVDDVLTTGSTLSACIHELQKASHVSVNILTLGFAHHT